MHVCMPVNSRACGQCAWQYFFTCTAFVVQEILEGRPYDAKSDLWSLGCVVHELCTLRYVCSSIRVFTDLFTQNLSMDVF